MELQSKTRLTLIFENLDLNQVAKSIESSSHKGPTGYNPKHIIRAFLAQQIEQIPTHAALVDRLESDPVFRFSCGFKVMGKVPSQATFSRYYNKLSQTEALEKLFYQMVSIAIKEETIDLESLAIDASKLESYERAVSKNKVDKENPLTPDWGAKYDSHHNKITWYGWKIHLVSDTKAELPIDFTITPANEADSNQALPLADRVYQSLDQKGFNTPDYWIMDSGYDYTKIYDAVYYDYGAQAIIPINKRNAKQPPAGYYDFKGTPCCSAGHKMVYWGHYNGNNKFRCPHVCGKVDCIHGSAWCSDSNYGHVTKTRPKQDPRYISIPHRDSSTWQEIYNQRTSVERTFSRLKENLNLTNITVMGARKVRVHVLLSCISLIAGKLAVERTKKSTEKAAA